MDSLDFLTSNDAAFPKNAREHHADAHLVLWENDHVLARCSLWWTATPRHENLSLGAIGHYEATNESAGTRILTAAFRHLREAGAQLAVGPLNGNTWRSYRFMTEPGTEPPFFLEPACAPTALQHFLTTGFRPLAEYFSALCSDPTIIDPRLTRVEERLVDEGLTIRPLNLAHFEQVLTDIYTVSTVGFLGNFLYTPITQGDFLAQYLPLRDLINPQLVLLAEIDHRPVGYIFGIPDFAQKQRGSNIDTVILKTVACLPGRRLAGLGALLVGRFHAIVQDLGYRRIIHALMHESNNSRNLSSVYATTMRRYTLFSHKL